MTITDRLRHLSISLKTKGSNFHPPVGGVLKKALYDDNLLLLLFIILYRLN